MLFSWFAGKIGLFALLLGLGGVVGGGMYQKHQVTVAREGTEKALKRAVEAETQAGQYRGSLEALQATVEARTKDHQKIVAVLNRRVKVATEEKERLEETLRGIDDVIEVDKGAVEWFNTTIPDSLLLELDEDTEPLGDRGL